MGNNNKTLNSHGEEKEIFVDTEQYQLFFTNDMLDLFRCSSPPVSSWRISMSVNCKRSPGDYSAPAAFFIVGSFYVNLRTSWKWRYDTYLETVISEIKAAEVKNWFRIMTSNVNKNYLCPVISSLKYRRSRARFLPVMPLPKANEPHHKTETNRVVPVGWKSERRSY